MIAAQYPLPFSYEPALCSGSFFVSDSNRDAHAWIEAWPAWPAQALVLHGPHASGKTHLARIWAQKARAIFIAPAQIGRSPSELLLPPAQAAVIEDFEQAGQEGLFHLLNHIRETGSFLLLTTTKSRAAWPFTLADLTSRLGSLPWTALAAPDDALLAAALAKQFADRHMRVAPDVIYFLVMRMERALAAAQTLVEALDRASLAEKRPVSVALARDVLTREKK